MWQQVTSPPQKDILLSLHGTLAMNGKLSEKETRQ